MARHPLVGGLGPLQADLQPDVHDLAVFLREQFSMLGTTVRAYAKQHNWDPGTVSRFLSGSRIPTPEFVDALVADVTENTDAGTQQSRDDLWGRGRDLRLKALQQRNARAAEVERLRQELSEAEHESRRSMRRESLLTQNLLDKEAEYDSLMEKYRQMEEERQRLDHGPQAIEQGRQRNKLDLRRDEVSKDLVRLKRELADERRIRIVAERRRDQLQEALNEANLRLIRSGSAIVEVSDDVKPMQLFVFFVARRTRWSGITGLVAVPAAVYGGPVYLGMIYGALPAAQSFLRWLSIVAILIPIWLAYGIRRVEHTGGFVKKYPFIMTIAMEIFIFWIGTLLYHFILAH